MTDEPLLPTKQTVGEYDAIETAKPDEPLFPLQGGDPFAPATIEFWADLARTAGRSETDSKKAHKLLNKATAAEQVAWRFRAYQRGEGAAAMEQALRDEVAQATDRNMKLARGADRLNNALAESFEIADMLAGFGGEFEWAEQKIRRAVELLREASAHIEPRRHMRRG